MTNKRAARRDRFNRLATAGVACGNTKIGDPDVPDYHTGRQSKFKVANGRTDLKHEDSVNAQDIEGVPLSPRFKTPQWVRTLS